MGYPDTTLGSMSEDASETPKRRWRLVRWGLALLGIGLLIVYQLLRAMAGERVADVAVERFGEPAPAPMRPLSALTIACINVAHGRATHSHQVFRSQEEITTALDAIAAFIAAHDADIACYQEIDAPSWWSGDVDHLARIVPGAGHAVAARTLSVDGLGLHYGTAISSRWPIHRAEAHTFAPTPPSPSKGFTLAELSWPGDPAFRFHLVSLHLDFTSADNRAEQVDRLLDRLQAGALPVIVAGDFNAGHDPDGAMHRLTEAIEGRAIDPGLELVTFPSLGSWIDWVVVTEPFHIRSAEAPDVALSDHRPLVVSVGRQAPGDHP